MKVFPPVLGEHEPNIQAAMADGVQSFSHDGASQRFQDSGFHCIIFMAKKVAVLRLYKNAGLFWWVFITILSWVVLPFPIIVVNVFFLQESPEARHAMLILVVTIY